MTKVKKIETITEYTLSKKEKKQINKEIQFEYKLEEAKEYKFVKCRNKLNLVTLDGVLQLFKVGSSLFLPTLKSNLIVKTAILDSGALKPIQSGADVMCPGIYKYRDMVKISWKAKEIVAISIIDVGLVAIGIAEMGFDEINEQSKGVAIEVYHFMNDPLYKL